MLMRAFVTDFAFADEDDDNDDNIWPRSSIEPSAPTLTPSGLQDRREDRRKIDGSDNRRCSGLRW